MAYTTPRTWVAGDVLTAAQLNQDVRDNISFLANPPACRVYHNTTQSVADITETTVAFNSERFDTNTMHDTVTNNSRITINTAGLYVVACNLALAAAGDYNRFYIAVRLNGTTEIVKDERPGITAGPEMQMLVSTVYKFAAADYIEVRVFHDNTTNVARNVLSTGNKNPEFSAVWVGLG